MFQFKPSALVDDGWNGWRGWRRLYYNWRIRRRKCVTPLLVVVWHQSLPSSLLSKSDFAIASRIEISQRRHAFGMANHRILDRTKQKLSDGNAMSSPVHSPSEALLVGKKKNSRIPAKAWKRTQQSSVGLLLGLREPMDSWMPVGLL